MLIHMPIFVTFLFLRWMRVKHFRPCKVSPLSQERKKLVKFTPLSIIRVPLCYKHVWVESCESFCLAPIQVRYEVPTQFGQSGQSKVYKKSPSGQDCSCIGYLPLFGHPQLCHQMVSQHTRPPQLPPPPISQRWSVTTGHSVTGSHQMGGQPTNSPPPVAPSTTKAMGWRLHGFWYEL